MGYYVDKTESRIVFKKGLDLDGAVLNAVRGKMFEPEYFAKHASGGCFPKSGDLFKDQWYSWTDSKQCLDATTLVEFMRQFIDEVECIDKDGALWFNFNSKMGDERLLFEALAPFLKAGSYVDWRGEDGEHWRWEFRYGRMVEKAGRVVYE